MSQQQNDSTKTLNLHNQKVTNFTGNKTSKTGRRGEAKYQNVCIACRLPNTKKLVTIRRAGGRDLHLCHKHARQWLGEL